ncbi:MAG: FixH family protein [Deltaproteobacteria bacterium]|nr:FixH family protein [Deltaproteobacteria bacterium]
MKRVIFLLMILTLMVGPAWGKNYEVTKKVDDYTVRVEIDKNPPIVGENNLSLTIKDGSGKNITDAKVKVEYSMPAMPGMPAMNYKADAVLKGSEYKAKVNFSMAGSWGLVVQITQAEKVKKVKLNVDVK